MKYDEYKLDNKRTLLTRFESEYLHRIGLSFDAIRVYELLLATKQMTARELADKLLLFPSAIYRLCYELETAKLIRVVRVRPRQFAAINKALGLEASYEQQTHLLQKLIKIAQLSSSDKTELIIGRQPLYDAYLQHARHAKHDIRVYSIGIAFSEELEQIQKAARKRGVIIWHVIQQQKLSNQHVVSKWQRVGVRLRYLPKARGFHFYIIDTKLVCITFSDPNDTENRLSVVTDNQAAVDLFGSQFQVIWNQARDINTKGLLTGKK